MKVAINVIEQELKEQYNFVIGVERGALKKCDLALADFDSVNEKELTLIKKKKHKILPTEKDETDVEAAILYAKKMEAEVIDIFLPTSTNRIDHIITNLLLAHKHGVNLYFENCKIEIVDKEYVVDKNSMFSVYCMEEAYIKIEGAKWAIEGKISPLETKFISNESKNKTKITTDKRVLVYTLMH